MGFPKRGRESFTLTDCDGFGKVHWPRLVEWSGFWRIRNECRRTTRDGIPMEGWLTDDINDGNFDEATPEVMDDATPKALG